MDCRSSSARDLENGCRSHSERRGDGSNSTIGIVRFASALLPAASEQACISIDAMCQSIDVMCQGRDKASIR
jgi:hypothetical protein